jgi:hypothetical protein
MLIYSWLVFFVSRLVVPNLGFKRPRIPKKIPYEFEKAINNIKKRAKNKEDYAKKMYNYLGKQFYGEGGSVWREMPFIFEKKMNILWNKKKLHCHQLNHLYRTALIKSNLFNEKDIKIKHEFSMLNMHQFLKVNLGVKKKRWVEVDLFAKNLGYGFGKSMPSFFIPSNHFGERKISSVIIEFFSGFFYGVYYIIKNYIFKRIF